MKTTGDGVDTFTVRRLTVPVPSVRGFQSRYQCAVPEVPRQQIEQLVATVAPWSAMVDLVAEMAPFGFLIYFKNGVHPVMTNARDKADCVADLMGNHVIAETTFRHDPRAMLYAPLRTLVWEDSTGAAWFTADQPSTQFGGLGIPEVRQVGLELDQKLAALLQALDVPVPKPLIST
jgi:hypothetical protein